MNKFNNLQRTPVEILCSCFGNMSVLSLFCNYLENGADDCSETSVTIRSLKIIVNEGDDSFNFSCIYLIGFYLGVSVLTVACSKWKQRLVKRSDSRNENKMIKPEDTAAVCCNMMAANFGLGALEFSRVQQGMCLYWVERFNVLAFVIW